MRVGLVIYGSLETLSGGFLYDRRLVEHLRRCGDTVEIISLPWQAYPRLLAHNLSPSIARRLRELDADLLLQDELNHPSLFLLNRFRRKIPTISIVHHLRCLEERPAWQNRFYRRIERAYLESVDGFLCNSSTTLETVRAVLPAPHRDKPHRVALPGGGRLDPHISSEELRRRALSPGPLQILFAGSVIPRKGLHHLLRALKQIERTDWRLTVAGSLQTDPAYSRRVQRQAAQAGLRERARFAGAVPEAELAELMRGAHVLAVPSAYEGFGIVYLEGMGFGLPALASGQGGAAELVREGENGFLIGPGEVEALAEHLAWLAENREGLLEMSLAARQTYLAHPTWEESMNTARQFLLAAAER